MNNRYICRGKRKDNDEWVEGFAIFADNKAFILNNAKVEFITGFNENRLNFVLVEVIPETVGQCTGLKDKNGKPIFEGDVLKQKTTKEFAKFNSFKWELYGIVTFGNYDYNESDAGYCSVGWYIAPLKSIAIYPKDYLIGDIQPGLNQEDILKSIYPMEVIGNIYDNPNLLKIEHDSLCETETYKAENEKLKVELKQKNPYEEYGNCVAIGDSLVFTHTLNDYDKLIKDIGTEAIWEFAERLKNKIWYNPACNRYRTITPDDIYDLARKMMEVQE